MSSGFYSNHFLNDPIPHALTMGLVGSRLLDLLRYNSTTGVVEQNETPYPPLTVDPRNQRLEMMALSCMASFHERTMDVFLRPIFATTTSAPGRRSAAVPGSPSYSSNGSTIFLRQGVCEMAWTTFLEVKDKPREKHNFFEGSCSGQKIDRYPC